MRCGLCSLSVPAVIFSLLIAACSDTVAPPEAATIEASSAVGELAFLGVPVAVNPEVLVRDENRLPVAGVNVKFTVTAGGGSVANSSTISGPQGRATAGRWTIGTTPGINTLAATVDGAGTVEFRVEAVPAPSGRFELRTIDGWPLPVGGLDARLIAEAVTVNSDGSFTRSQDYMASGGEEWRQEQSGIFSPHGLEELSFHLAGTLPCCAQVLTSTQVWAAGRIEGDALTLRVNSWDDNEIFFVQTYVYVRADIL
jgi:hypothetical protein